MHYYLLNIGLNLPGTELQLDAVTTARAALDYLRELDPVFYNEGRYAAHESATEATLVLSVSGAAPYSRELDELAAMLCQEAIAYVKTDPAGRPLLSTGMLFGPKADAWGPFNPAYFLLPDGTTADER